MSTHKSVETIRLQGIPVSQGIIIGKTRLVDRSRIQINYLYLNGSKESRAEVRRFKDALKSTKKQILTIKNGMSEQIKEHSFILDTHLMIIDDKMISETTVKTIRNELINAEWALKKSVDEIRQAFEKIDYEYIRDRMNDVEAVTERILLNLVGKEHESLANIDERVIVVAHDLSPTDTSELNTDKVMGFITNAGGRTSHTAIMAKAFKLPAVVGLESVTSQVQDGTLLIVDGYNGNVIINPDDDEIIRYQEKQLYHEKYESSILKDSHLPSETTDNYRVTIKANIEFLEEIDAAKELVTEGIGLYRTEFLYLRQKRIPSEDELFEDYREVVEQISPSPVTIRTLDIGRDKFPSEMLEPGETNPALGLKSIRFCLENPEIFRSQLRAILRASAFGRVRLMFPMISGLQELIDSKKVLHEVMEELDSRNIAYDKNIAVGIMIEIPSAAAIADILAKHVDFFSIGTNDLIQYSLAIDRTNEHVAHIYRPYHPGIIRMINFVAKSANEAGINVSLCGEMAGDPMCVPILLGTGIDELSINTEGIPLIKSVIRSLSRKEAMEDLEELLTLPTSKDIRRFLEKRIEGVMPKIIENGLQENIS
ncbi:MAG: phosphoenolpyruvate--protein phosphotransferase [Deltaproteobacteria bacterium]|nr:phosphoenolpyruvate--protein phosphotransferase [Deltaproteobacteria bacterium]MBW1913501.1 phosphoenolpyruvate--protein phosphotransferase [Deltaproteobacteria bacterium]